MTGPKLNRSFELTLNPPAHVPLMPEPRHRWSRALRALIGCVLLTTCGTDSPIAPGQQAEAHMDVTGLLRAGGQVPVPIDTVFVELRHTSDSTVAFSEALSAAAFSQRSDSLIVKVQVDLRSSPEQFFLYAEARGRGVVYYTVRSVVTASSGVETPTPSLPPTYVGPGAAADSVQLFLAAPSVPAGDSVLAHAVVFQGGAVVPGVPVGIISLDTLLVRWRPVGVDSAWLFAAPTATGSVTIQAVTPTGLTRNLVLGIAAAADSLLKVAGDSQQVLTSTGSQPLVVQVLDASGAPYAAGYTVNFALVSPPAGASITPASVVSDSLGFASATLLTGTGTGAVTATATALGLKGSPVQFALTILQGATGPASVTPVTATSQSAIANQLVAAPPSVVVRDSGGAPLANILVTFSVAGGGGSLTGASQTTNVSGIATVGGWRLGTGVGVNSLTANVAGLPPATFNATAVPTAVTQLVRISGDSQADTSGRTLPQPLVAEVQDSFGNVVPGIVAAWTATDGSVNPTADTSDAQGRVQTSWTLGSTQAAPTATVVAGVAQTSFSATTLFSTPTIGLSFAGIPGVGIGLTAKVLVTLNSPAPSGGTRVTLVSGNTGFFTVSPANVTIPQGATVDSVTVTGVGAGSATLDATATGYTAGALTVVVQNRNISVPPTLSVPYGQTQSLPIVLPAPAPAGGVTFTVTSADTTRVGVLTPTVTIAAGGQSANATLSGVLPGTAAITVSNPGYANGVTAATTLASLDITATSLGINASFGSPITVNFTSGGSPVAAPSPGIPVTLVSRDTLGCVAATTPVTIVTGQATVTSQVSYGGGGVLPCSGYLVATATNLQPDSILVTVNPAPAVTTNIFFAQIGQGLMESGNVSLGASNHGGVTVTVTSSDSNLVVLSTAVGTPGTGSLSVPVLPLVTSFTIYAQAREGANGTVVLTATAPGFSPVPDTIAVVTPAVELQGLPTSTSTFSSPNNIYAQIGVPNGQLTALSRVQNHRPGVAPLVATFALAARVSAGLLVDSVTPAGGLTGHASIGPAVYYTSTSGPATGGIAYQPVNAGNDTVSVSIPSFIPMASATRGIAISQPTSGITVFYPQVGVGLQEAGSVSLSASQHGGVNVTLRSGDATLLVVDTLVNGPGHDSIVKPLANGQSSLTYYVQVKEFSQFLSAYLYVTVPGFAPDSVLVSAVQPGVELQGLPTTTTTLTGPNNLYAQIGVPNGQLTGLARVQNLAGGATQPVVVTFVSQGIGGILADTITQSFPGGGSDTATAAVDTTGGIYYTPTGGPNFRGVQFRPQAAGNDTVTVSASGFVTLASGTRGITVSQPTTNITLNYPQVGSGLQEGGGGFLSASQHGGAAVTITSRNPSAVTVDTLSNGPGYAAFTKSLSNGQTGITIYYQALEGVVDSSWVVLTEPRFAPDSVLVRTVAPGIELQGLPTQMTPFDADANLFAQVGVLNTGNATMARIQNRRGGSSASIPVTFTSSLPALGVVLDTLTAAGGGAGSGTSHLVPNAYYSPTSGPAFGGISFRPLLIGQDSVFVQATGFTTATISGRRGVNVVQPGITMSMNFPTVGSGLQEAGSGSLASSQHGGVTITLTSSDSTILILAPNATTPGAGSIQIPMANGQSFFSYVAQAKEGLSSPVTVTVTAVASGFTNGTVGVTVDRPAIEVQGLGTTYTAGGADVNTYAQVGVANSQNSALARVQTVRAGAPSPVVVVFTSTSPAVGTLVDSVGAGTPKSAQISNSGSLYYTPTGGPAQGGVAFRPLATGSTVVSAAAGGYLTLTTNGFRTVTVQ